MTEPTSGSRPDADTDIASRATTSAGSAELPDWVGELPSALDVTMGLELLEVSAERVVGRMPVKGNTQPIGLWHGGASCVLAETLGSIGAAAYGMPEKFAVGVDINATHHRSVRSGHVTGTATALKLGRTTAMYEIVLTDDDDNRICTARLTCQLISRPKPAGGAAATLPR